MEDTRNWKPWTKEAFFTIKKGRYWVKFKDGSVHYDDFKYRGSFGWGFSGDTHRHIIEYAEFN